LREEISDAGEKNSRIEADLEKVQREKKRLKRVHPNPNLNPNWRSPESKNDSRGYSVPVKKSVHSSRMPEKT